MCHPKALYYCIYDILYDGINVASEHRQSHLQSPSCLGQPPVMAKAVLSFHQLVENSDESFLLDNEALNLWDRKPFAPVGVAGSHLVNVRCWFTRVQQGCIDGNLVECIA